jgi:hypothetical protein
VALLPKTVGVNAFPLEACILSDVCLSPFLSGLGLSGAATTLLDAVKNKTTKQKSTNTSTTCVDSNLGRLRDIFFPLLRHGPFRLLVHSFVCSRVPPDGGQ